jgi:zinc transporter ZupT
MLTTFQWVCFFSIFAMALAGGYYPLFRLDKNKSIQGFPNGEAFAAGVFLALSLTLMLPSGFHLFRKALPKLDFPVGSVIAIVAFLILLSIEHYTMHLKASVTDERQPLPPILPVIMTLMIAVPSFFLGAALAISATTAAFFIFIAILAHKGSAGFALALKLRKSTLSSRAALIIFICFALSTPLGILFGAEAKQFFSGEVMLLVKACIISLAAGVFLYMSTLHELRHTPLISICCNRKGFLLLIAGFVLTALIRLLIGEAHKII